LPFKSGAVEKDDVCEKDVGAIDIIEASMAEDGNELRTLRNLMADDAVLPPPPPPPLSFDEQVMRRTDERRIDCIPDDFATVARIMVL